MAARKNPPAVRSGRHPSAMTASPWVRYMSISVSVDTDGVARVGLAWMDTLTRKMVPSHEIHLLGVGDSSRDMVEALHLASQYYLALAAQGAPL